ncbi:hypothetical protein PFISCL1PPCAC_27245, partial [Pristionchus fissidentatus]
MRWILFLLSSIHLSRSSLPQDNLTKEEYEDIVRMIFKYIYAHEDICGTILTDERWMPAGTDCFIPCEYTSNVCLLKSNDRSDPHQYCKQLPSRCVAGIRREVGMNYLTPTQAPVDPDLYYYGRGDNTTTAKPVERIHSIEKEIYQMMGESTKSFMPEQSLKSIERDNQILFDTSTNQVFGPPRPSHPPRVSPSLPPAYVPYELPVESNPYLDQYFRGRKEYMGETTLYDVTSVLRRSRLFRTGNNGLPPNRKTDKYTVLYEGANGEVVARGPAFDQKSPPLPIFLVDDKTKEKSTVDGNRKLIELTDEEILGGFHHSSG